MLKIINTVLSIVNQKIVPEKTLSENIVQPLLGNISLETKRALEDSLLLSVLFFLLVIVVLAAVITLLVICKRVCLPRCCSPCQKLYFVIEGKLMFNSLLRACLQTFLVTMIALFATIRAINLDTSQGRIDFGLLILIGLYSIAFVVFSWKFLRAKKERLGDPAFRRHYESLYTNVDYLNPSALSFTCAYLIRRMLYAAVINFGDLCPISVQLLLAQILSTCLLVFYLRVKPMYQFTGNLLEISNELTISVSLWLLLLFSDFVVDAETRYDLGYGFLYLCGASVALNVLVFLFTVIKQVHQAYLRMIAKRQSAKNRV